MALTRRRFVPLLLAAPAALAQRSSSLRRVTAWTTNGGGALSPGELKSSISAVVEGSPAKAARIKGPESDLLLFVVLDLVGDLAFVDPARQSLISEIRGLPAHVWPAILRAQDGLRVAADPAPDPADAIAAIENTQIGGRAGLLETVEPAVRLADSLITRNPVRVAILYVTDSSIYNYREDYTNPVINPSDSRDLSRRFPEGLIREKSTTLANSLAAFDVPVFIVHLAFLRDRLNEAYQNGLQLMAETTGGSLSMCRTPNDVPGVIAAALTRIREHWAIDLEVPDTVPRNFTVQLSAPNVTFQHRTRFARGR